MHFLVSRLLAVGSCLRLLPVGGKREREREKPGGEQKMTEVQKEHDAQIMRATQVLL